MAGEVVDEARPVQKEAARPDPRYDCRSCGACCRVGYVVGTKGAALTPRERERHVTVGRRLPLEVLGSAGRQRVMRVRLDASCSALVRHRDGRFSCGVYARRPAACSGFPPGGEGCLASRLAHGLPVWHPVAPSWYYSARDMLRYYAARYGRIEV